MRHQGVLRLEFVTIWALAAWAGPEIVAPEFDWTVRPFSAHAPAVAPDRVPSVLDHWARGDGPTRYWDGDRGWPSMIDALRIPASFTSGWWDLFLRGMLRDRSRHAARSGMESLLAIEATDHAGHDWGDGPSPDPLADWDTLARRMPSVLRGELAFLRKHLLGLDGEVPVGPVSWVQTHAGSRTAASWPPPGTELRRLFLADGGRARQGPEGGVLADAPDRIPIDACWTHDPQDLVPSLEGEAIGGWFHRPDERTTQVRDDVLTFTSELLRESVDLAGPIIADLVVEAGTSAGHIMVKVCDVYPEGEARRIADGACLIAGGDSATAVQVDVGQTGYRVRAGHRLRLEISASAFPRYIWHPGTAEDPWLAMRSRQSQYCLRTGPGGSSLVITVQAAAA
jgi:putative CocE/NonD family hydrolase